MAEIHWIKLKTKMFDDEKIKLIEAMPEADLVLVIWIKLLLQAGKSNSNGDLMLFSDKPYTIEMLSTIFNRPLPKVNFAIKILIELQLIEITNSNVISVINWEKHQNITGLDNIREQNRLRQQKFRDNRKILENRKIEDNQTKSNVMSHNDNAIDTDTDTDTEKEEKSLRKNYKTVFAEVSEEFELSEDIKEIFWVWFKYKAEKKQSYKSTGMRTLIKTKLLETSGNPQKLKDMVLFSISNNYQGLFQRTNNNGNGKTRSTDEGIAAIAKQYFPEEVQQR